MKRKKAGMRKRGRKKEREGKKKERENQRDGKKEREKNRGVGGLGRGRNNEGGNNFFSTARCMVNDKIDTTKATLFQSQPPQFAQSSVNTVHKEAATSEQAWSSLTTLSYNDYCLF